MTEEQNNDSIKKAKLQVAALKYESMGYHVFPVHYADVDGHCSCKKPECPDTAKHPMVPWSKGRMGSKAILSWWSRKPFSNIGIVTGAASGVWVLDVDSDEAATKFKSWQREYGDINLTARVRTSRGWHFYFRYPEHAVIKSRARIAEGIDVRGEGGYVLAPPSQHASGAEYAWCDDAVIQNAPDWLVQMVTAKRTVSSGASKQAISNGNRNDSIFKIGSGLRGAGKDKAEIKAELNIVNETRCEEPLDEREIEQITNSVAKYAKGPRKLSSDRLYDNPLFYLPLNVNEVLADRDLLYMNDAQRGIYFMLLLEAWKGRADLPTDLGELRILSRSTSSKQAFAKNMEVIVRTFDISEDETTVRIPWLRELFQKQLEKYLQTVRAGKSSAAKKAATKVAMEDEAA